MMKSFAQLAGDAAGWNKRGDGQAAKQIPEPELPAESEEELDDSEVLSIFDDDEDEDFSDFEDEEDQEHELASDIRAMNKQPPGPGRRKPVKSAFGASEAFTDYFGSGEEWDAAAGRNKDHGGERGSRLGVGRSFAEEAEKYLPNIVVRQHSRFGDLSDAMAAAYPVLRAITRILSGGLWSSTRARIRPALMSLSTAPPQSSAKP